jgi:hypothetical protein
MANDPIVLLVLGFLLTSVLGGGLAYLFQQRAWRHQYEIQKQDLHHQQALKTFEEQSSLLDQRLYRMRLIFWAATRLARQPLKPASLDTELTDYRAVLRVWNDNLNRNLALIDTYFGEAARLQLETELFAEYSAIGEELDEFVREVTTANETPVQVRPIGSRLSELSARVYQFNVFMLRSLRDDDGHAARLPADEHARRALRFGHDGADVRSLQRVLARLGLLSSKEDGHRPRYRGRGAGVSALTRTSRRRSRRSSNSGSPGNYRVS